MGRGRNRPDGTDDTGRFASPPSTRRAPRRSVRLLRSRTPSSLDNSGTTRAVSVRSPPGSRARTRPERAAFGLRARRFGARERRNSPNDRGDVGRQGIHSGGVGVAPGSDREILCRTGAQRRQQTSPCELAKPPLETVAFDGGLLMTWHDDPDPRMRERGREHADLEVRRADSPPLLNHFLNIEASGETGLARKSEAAPPLRRRRIWSAA
jgi:hypothetical protein